MFQIEQLSNYIGDKLSFELKLDKESRDVIAYGAFALIQTIISILLTFALGLFFGVAVEAVLISFIVSILRKYSGGVHATNSTACTIIGTAIFIILGVVLKLLTPHISFAVAIMILTLTFILCYYLAIKLAPVESLTKKISSQKKLRMKKKSICTLNIYIVLAFSAIILYYYFKDKILLVFCLCICLGSAWQMFTLTKAGHLFLGMIDMLFNHIFKLKGGK